MNNAIKEIEIEIANLEARINEIAGSLDPERVEMAQDEDVIIPELAEMEAARVEIKALATRALQILGVGK
jgi:hypothetical protein